jgi:DNA repair exonuclease SbcCD nuclease subunit
VLGRVNDPRQTVVILTGDLVDVAFNPVSWFRVKSFVRSLKDHGFPVLVAPGNHDYGTGSWGLKFFINHFKQVYYHNPSITFPILDIIDETAYIALDSMVGTFNRYTSLFAQGRLGRSQLMRLDRMLDLPEVERCRRRVVYLHHHPMDYRPFMQLLDSEEFREVIENRIDLLLFGHYHEHENESGNTFHGSWGIPRCYNAGSSTGKDGKQGKIRLIDLNSDIAADRELWIGR